MDPKDDKDRKMAALADRQYGVVTRRQLLALGLTGTAIRHRLARRRLRRLYRGVFAVGHASLRREGDWMAAVLACGEDAVLSHADAAVLWNLVPPRGRLLHVTRPSSAACDPDPTRIRVHRIATLRAWETTVVDGLPTTTVARTLLDLSAQLRPRAIEDAIAQALRLHRFDLVAVRRCLDEHPRQHGAPALRRVLADLADRDPADWRSVLEVVLAELCDERGLPQPTANARVAGLVVDFLWPQRRLVVAADSYTYHSMPSAFERDRERDQQLTLAGYTVVRVTYKQVTRQRALVAARLSRLLR